LAISIPYRALQPISNPALQHPLDQIAQFACKL
jgi:hypothetical protein